MADKQPFNDPFEDFERFCQADPRFVDAMADNPEAVYAVPSILDAVREFEQDYVGERQTLVLDGMEAV